MYIIVSRLKYFFTPLPFLIRRQDDAKKLKDSPSRKTSQVKGKYDSENGQAEFPSDGAEDDLVGCSSEDEDLGNFREGSPVINIYDYMFAQF